jgi:hypothetical protein
MKTRCPNCGATLSLDAIVAHEGARDALYAAFTLGGELGAAAVSYLGLFRPEKRELSLDRVAKLLNEILPDVQAQRITRNGTVYDAPIDAWVWAMREAVKARDAGRLQLPLTSHGWLYQVITTYKPDTAQLVHAAKQGTTAMASSKTMSGLMALESLKHG